MEMEIIWTIAIVLFLVAEAMIAGLATIWFALGAVAGLIAAIFNVEMWLQILIFAAVSLASLVYTRPLVAKYVNTKFEPTNSDRLIGTTCIVTENIDNINAKGAASAGGKVWTARSVSDETINVGELCTIERIEGVKLIVSKKSEKENVQED